MQEDLARSPCVVRREDRRQPDGRGRSKPLAWKEAGRWRFRCGLQQDDRLGSRKLAESGGAALAIQLELDVSLQQVPSKRRKRWRLKRRVPCPDCRGQMSRIAAVTLIGGDAVVRVVAALDQCPGVVDDDGLLVGRGEVASMFARHEGAGTASQPNLFSSSNRGFSPSRPSRSSMSVTFTPRSLPGAGGP